MDGRIGQPRGQEAVSRGASEAGPRPPDPELRRRVFTATLEVYAELGWGGFTRDAVARRGKVGKAAIYRWWPTKEELLVAALESSFPDEDLSRALTGTIREQMVEIATQLTERYVSRHGLAQIRAQLEAKVFPDVLGVALSGLRRRTTVAAKAVVEAAIDRHELPASTSAGVVIDALVGAIVHRVLWISPEQQSALAADPGKFVERVVDLVLDGVRQDSAVADEMRHSKGQMGRIAGD